MPKPTAGAPALTTRPSAIRPDADDRDMGCLANILGGILERRTQAGEWVEYDPTCWQDRAQKLSREVNWLLGRVDECLAADRL